MSTQPIVVGDWEQAREALLVGEKNVMAVLGRRACALGAMCSAALHGVSLGHATSAPAVVLMAAMIVGCLYCARDLWIDDSLRGWTLVAVMNLVMIAVHLPAAGHHHGGRPAVSAMAAESTAVTLATAFAAAEALVATAVLVYRTRGARNFLQQNSGERVLTRQ